MYILKLRLLWQNTSIASLISRIPIDHRFQWNSIQPSSVTNAPAQYPDHTTYCPILQVVLYTPGASVWVYVCVCACMCVSIGSITVAMNNTKVAPFCVTAEESIKNVNCVYTISRKRIATTCTYIQRGHSMTHFTASPSTCYPGIPLPYMANQSLAQALLPNAL